MPLVHNPNVPPEPGSRAGALIALQVFFVAVALLVYCLRVYTRAFILRSIGHDDYIMGLAVILSIGLSINACISTTFGWGHHLSSIPPSNYSSILITIWIAELLFTLSTSLAKISILFFYLRLAVTKTYRTIIHCSIGFIIIWAITFTLVVIFQCTPIPEYWNPTGTSCRDPEAALFIHGLTNSLTDVYIYILPMKMVWEVQLPKRQRMGLIGIFAAGFLVCVAGALRLYYSILTQKSTDTPWEGFNLWTWESIEINLGIVCSSAPCLKALITKMIPRMFGSVGGSKGTGNGDESGRRGIGMGYLESGRRERDRERGESEDELTGRDGNECVLVAKMDVHQSWLKV
ncbi:uncharacterized protein LY89DRAFT_741544 [Mollisia scopiformis]|uniref:Rhodopsin domain-containing protein n=1 Tax=Mollisia scopiformis TaxID=149040 RepID=A0A132BAK7_MOLSC|nr:uncharacterized protein LY89DRAFT_741544 [Mollisia scopiformis]KUJ08697.1 hypothetical protein LY89DRAFT_741544 [Mollisia scopiformis]